MVGRRLARLPFPFTASTRDPRRGPRDRSRKKGSNSSERTVVTEIAFGPFTVDLANARITRDGVEVRLRPAGVSGAARSAAPQRPRGGARPDDRGGVGRDARVAPHRGRDRRRGEEEPGRIRALDHAPAQGGLLPGAAHLGGADPKGLALLGSPDARGRGAGDRAASRAPRPTAPATSAPTTACPRAT